MRPETLPKSYWKFIVKSGPIETPALEAVRRSIRKLPIDLHSFNAFIKKRGGTAFLTTAFPAQVSAAIIIAQQLFGLQKRHFVSKKTPVSCCIIKSKIAWGIASMMQRRKGLTMRNFAAAQLVLGLTRVVVCRSQMQCCTLRPHQLWCTV